MSNLARIVPAASPGSFVFVFILVSSRRSMSWPRRRVVWA
jgi:hypothetical protein